MYWNQPKFPLRCSATARAGGPGQGPEQGLPTAIMFRSPGSGLTESRGCKVMARVNTLEGKGFKGLVQG